MLDASAFAEASAFAKATVDKSADKRCLVPNARKMVSMGKIGKYKDYRTLRRARERGRERGCV